MGCTRAKTTTMSTKTKNNNAKCTKLFENIDNTNHNISHVDASTTMSTTNGTIKTSKMDESVVTSLLNLKKHILCLLQVIFLQTCKHAEKNV